ncbi:MAG: spondin domain-containing protein [Candidatus Eisenbacteria bacterium]|nr:spondin domain-containing protein [Candidatus Eisenbacteria bacterium]
MKLIAIASLVGLTFVAGSASATSYEMVIENLVPGGPATGQPLSPPVVAIHSNGYRLFEVGHAGTPGLDLLAREGIPDDLALEAEQPTSVFQVLVGSGPFYDPQTIRFDADPGDLLSVAMMLGRTNDLFTGISAEELPSSGERVFYTDAYDAGAEVNSGLVQDIPFYGNHNAGADERGTVAVVNSYSVYDDPLYGQLDWTFPPAARITVRVLGPTAAQETTWGEVRALYR